MLEETLGGLLVDGRFTDWLAVLLAWFVWIAWVGAVGDGGLLHSARQLRKGGGRRVAFQCWFAWRRTS
jgi:hypothetical protein